MQGNFYRNFFIVAALVVAAINIYPTAGWMMLSEEAREARLTRWQEEDAQRARETHGALDKFTHMVKRWSEFNRDQVINLGLDLQGGIHMVLSFDINELDPERLAEYREREYTDANISEEVQKMVLEQVRRRVNDFETDEPLIQTLGSNQIQVQLPGEKDLQRVQRLIKKAAVLNFHIVDGADGTVRAIEAIKSKYPEFVSYLEKPELRGEPFRVSTDNYVHVADILAKVETDGNVMPEGKLMLLGEAPKPNQEQYYKVYVVDKTPIQSGEGLTSAAAIPDSQNPPYWQILFAFSNAAGAEFGTVTDQNRNRQMAIVVDDVVISAPSIRDRITTNGQITGQFDAEDAVDLAIALNSGSMVVPLHEEFSRVIGATLGADSVRKGVTSSLLGFVVVAVFMAVYYLLPGIVSVIALFMNALLLIAAMAYFDLTLTLPGIAGLILTMGMAVDANVLIFERIREELRLGHSIISSLDNGFKKATVTILDANITTLIAALVLFQFGTGPIEGFAITLSIGVCTSVFTALIVSRAVFDVLVARKSLGNLKMLSLINPDTHFPFMAYRVPAALASLLVIAVGMGYFVVRGEDNFGVDFKEGTNLELVVNADAEVPVENIRTALSGAGFGTAIVQRSMDDSSSMNTFLIRVGETDLKNDAATPEGGEAPAATFVSERIKNALAPLATAGSADNVAIESEQTVGPAVGSQLRNDAFSAIIFSMVFIVLYIMFRFEWKFSVGALIALAHDVLITIGIMSLMGREISMTVVAAILTIIGYSLNDTIVVFDRIREDMQMNRGKGVKQDSIMDAAINSTLSRTILTALTTLFVVVVLFFFGGVAINDFALALILGITVGTYSSVFIASPVVFVIQEWLNKRRQEQLKAAESNKGGKAKKTPKKVSDDKATV